MASRCTISLPKTKQRTTRRMKNSSWLCRRCVEDKSYLVALPFNVKNPVLPNERRHYKTTAGHILRRFKRNPGIFKKYNDQIEEYRRQGFIEKLGPEEARSRCEFIHYDPHHPVIRLDKNSTKVRIVFNASFGKPSLKDILESGQNLTSAMC